MNLVEFPLALLSERAPEGLLTLEGTDEIEERGVTIKRQVIVAAIAKFGLPTAKDEDVLTGMLQLAKLHERVHHPVVSFTRLQLIKLLGWENTRWSYDRIALALTLAERVDHLPQGLAGQPGPPVAGQERLRAHRLLRPARFPTGRPGAVRGRSRPPRPSRGSAGTASSSTASSRGT